MRSAYKAYLKQCINQGNIQLEQDKWPTGAYGGQVEFLLGVRSLNFYVIFSYYWLVFISHNLAANSSLCFGGHYQRSKSEVPSNEMGLTQMMVEEIITNENCDDQILTNEQRNPTLQLCYSVIKDQFV